MRKRVVAALCAAMLVLTVVGNVALASSTEHIYSLNDYDNNQVIVYYLDGSWQLESCESRQALSDCLKRLSDDSTVDFYQPNFTYESTGSAIPLNDAYIDNQWALYNDGSFTLNMDAYTAERTSAFYSGYYGDSDYFGNRDPFTGVLAASDTQGNYMVTTTAVEGVDIDAGLAMSSYSPARHVTVAIIDTGVDMGHEDLGDVFWVNEDEKAGNGIDDDLNGYVDDVNGWSFYYASNETYSGAEDSHGTHCAGTVAATAGNGLGIAGLVDDGSVSLMVLKVLGGSNSMGTTSNVIEAIEYAEANGASIVNLSFSTARYDRALYQAIEKSSMLFVVAAGNSGLNIDDGGAYPASFDLDNIISAAAASYDGLLYRNSNFGAAAVDIASPGDHIVGLYAESKYAYMAGTSMAAPMVTAAAAMVYCQHKGLSLDEVRETILSTATYMASLDGAVATAGLLDAGAAVTLDLRDLPSRNVAFADVRGHWAENDIAEAVRQGLFTGTGDGYFSPDTVMTRAMMVTTLYRLAGSPDTGSARVFSDVDPGAYYGPAVSWAYTAKIAGGTGDGKFSPDAPVTREQTATMLLRCAVWSGMDTSVRGNLGVFTDSGSISSYATDALSWANGAGIINGRTQTILDPTGGATRAQMAAMLVRFSA